MVRTPYWFICNLKKYIYLLFTVITCANLENYFFCAKRVFSLYICWASSVPEVLRGLRVPLPQPISEEHVSVAPEKLRRGRAGRWADEADLIPAGENLALGVNYHRWGLYNWSQTEAKCWRWLSEGLMTWAEMSLPTIRVCLCFTFTLWLI